MATSEAHRVPSTTPSSGDWDDDSASSSSELVLTRAGSDTNLVPRSAKSEETVINLKSLSNSDPRRKEILALASEYKNAQRAYKELKKREGETSKEVDRIRDELRERTNKLQAKEEKERRSGKEYKGRKKKGLDKARQRSREMQRMYEDSTLMLRRLHAEVKETAVRLNEKGNMLRELWQNRGRPKELPPVPPRKPQQDGPASTLSTPSPVYSFESSASSDQELERASREHDEAYERAREEARINRIEKARARFRSAVIKEDDAHADTLHREAAAAPFLSSPQLSVPAQSPQPEPGPETGRGRSRSILDMQKRLGLVPASPAATPVAVPHSGGAGGGDGDDEERRKKEEILARLQKGHGVSFMPFSMQRGMEEREQREKRETAVVAHPSRLSGGDVESGPRTSAMQTAEGRLTYHQRPMQAGKRRPSALSRRERSRTNERAGDGLAEPQQHQAAMVHETLVDEAHEEQKEEAVEEEPAVVIMSEEQVEQEAEKMRADLKEEMRLKRERRQSRERDAIAAVAAAAVGPASPRRHADEAEEKEKAKEEERPAKPQRTTAAEQRAEKRARARAARETDLREEKEMALRELQTLIEENDKLLREMEQKERERDRERRADKEAEAFLTRKLEAGRLEAAELRATIGTLQSELHHLRQRLDAESDQSRSVDEQRLRELVALQTDKAALEAELADVRRTLDATRAELDAIRQRTEAREQEREPQIERLEAQIADLRAAQGEAEMAMAEERQAKAELERLLEGARMEAEENKRHGENEVREREARLERRELEFAEVTARLKDKIREMKAVRQAYLDEKQQFEAERSRTLETVVSEQEDLYAKDKEIDELREQLRREREERERVVNEELVAVGRERDEKERQLGLVGLQLQKAKKTKHERKQELARLTDQLAGLAAEQTQWIEARAQVEEELDRERKARAGLETRVKQLEEEKVVSDEVVKRVGQRMEKQKREAEELLERERDEKRRLSEALEFERQRAAQLEREREEREQLEAQRQRERIEGGERQSQEEARLRDELEAERRGRDALLAEHEKELGRFKALAQDLDRERAERERAQAELDREREEREKLQSEKASLVALIEIERRRATDQKAADEALQRERDHEARERREMAERARREREALQKELRDRDEAITLKKEKTKLLRQKILVLMEENQRIKDGSRRDRERDKVERERKRDEESKRSREEKEREREERERIRKEKEKEVQEKERIRKEKQIEVEEKEKLRREMERERAEKEKLQRRKEQELDELRRDLQEKEIIEKNIYCADANAYCAGDVPRAALDLHTYLVQYDGTPAQKASFVRKVTTAISTSIQREAEDAEMQSFWLSYVATLSHMAHGQGDIESKPGLPGRDVAKDLRNTVVTRSVKDRGIVSRFWVESERRNLSRDEVKRVLLEALEKEKANANGNELAPLMLLELEVVMLDTLVNLLDAAMALLAPVLVPAIMEYRPFLSRRKSMVRREREKDKRRRPAPQPDGGDEEGPKVSPEQVTHQLKAFLQIVQKKKLYASVVQVIFEDLAHAINAHLFNTLVQRGELCTSAIGFQIKFGLSPLREWLFAASLADPARVRDCLGHIEEAANVLVVDKRLFTSEKDVKDIFQLLNPVQILHFLSAFRTDEESEMVPQESLQAVRHTIARANERMGMLRLKLDPHTSPLPPPSSSS